MLGNEIIIPSDLDEKNAWNFFYHLLVGDTASGTYWTGHWTFAEQDLLDRFTTIIYEDVADIPIPPGLDQLELNWAIVNDPNEEYLDLAWWSNVTFEWLLSGGPPWQIPFVPPNHVFLQESFVFLGNNAWQYWMGPVLKCIRDVEVTELTQKYGTSGAGQPHYWELRKSTLNQATSPPLSTYTDILASGTHVYTATADTWDEIPTGVLPLNFFVNDWIHPRAWQGPGAQVLNNIQTGRNNGWVFEDFFEVQGSAYVLDSGTFPGGTFPGPLPTSQTGTQAYGALSVFAKEQP